LVYHSAGLRDGRRLVTLRASWSLLGFSPIDWPTRMAAVFWRKCAAFGIGAEVQGGDLIFAAVNVVTNTLEVFDIEL
jgi:hypothetical protein